MSPKICSMGFLLFMFIASSAAAFEGAICNSMENTLTTPAVNIGDENFHYLELSLSNSNTDIISDVKEVREMQLWL